MVISLEQLHQMLEVVKYLADITKDRKIKSVAVTYTNNDYGKGLADVYVAAVKAHGIKVTTVAAHEDGKADYSAEVATLASAGGDAVAVLVILTKVVKV